MRRADRGGSSGGGGPRRHRPRRPARPAARAARAARASRAAHVLRLGRGLLLGGLPARRGGDDRLRRVRGEEDAPHPGQLRVRRGHHHVDHRHRRVPRRPAAHRRGPPLPHHDAGSGSRGVHHGAPGAHRADHGVHRGERRDGVRRPGESTALRIHGRDQHRSERDHPRHRPAGGGRPQGPPHRADLPRRVPR